MRYLLYLMFRCDVDVMENLELGGSFLGTKHSLRRSPPEFDPGFNLVVVQESIAQIICSRTLLKNPTKTDYPYSTVAKILTRTPENENEGDVDR